MDEENVLDFLTSLEAMDLPDRIEEVNGKILSKIIEDTEFVAVLFCKYRVREGSWEGIGSILLTRKGCAIPFRWIFFV